MEMLGMAILEVISCKRLNHAEQLKNVVNQMMINWMVERTTVLI
jgi:hypothetical protein